MIASASHKLTNDKAFELITSRIKEDVKILDLGAGRGYLARRVGEYLSDKGFEPKNNLLAADIFADGFEANEIPFFVVDFNHRLPFSDKSFDIIYSIEVFEHIRDPYGLLAECFRLLKSGGVLILSTPNILCLSSRFKFLLNGFYDLYEPPSIAPENGGRLCGHIMPLHIAYFDYGLRLSGFSMPELFTDKEKSLSLFLYYALNPLFRLAEWLNCRHVKRYDIAVYKESQHVLSYINSRQLMTARSLMLVANKP